MPTWRDKRTGRVFEGDEEGHPINTILPAKSVEESGKISAPTFEDKVYNYGGRFVGPILKAIGGLAGGAAMIPGGPASAMLGSARGVGLGSSAEKVLQTLAPQYFGEYKPESLSQIPIDIGKDIAIDALFTKGAKALGSMFPSAANEIFENFLSKGLKPNDPKIEKILQQPQTVGPKLDLTTGQTNRAAEIAENWLATGAKNERIAEQRAQIRPFFEQRRYPGEMLTQTAQANAENNASRLYGDRSQAYKDLDPFKKANTKTVQSAREVKSNMIDPATQQPYTRIEYDDIPIEGAISLTQSKPFVEELGKKLDDLLGPDDVKAASFGDGTGWQLSMLRKEVDKIRKVQTYLDPITKKPTASPIAAYDDLHNLKIGLDRFTQANRNSQIKPFEQTKLEALSRVLDNDLEAGVASWGDPAKKALEKAKNSHLEVIQKLRPDIAQDLIKAGKDPETTYMQVAREAMSDPARTRQFINVSGDKATAKQIFESNMSDSAFNAAKDIYDPGAALKYLDANRLIAKEVMTPAQITGMRNFLSKANLVKDIPTSSGSALTLSRGRAAISLIGSGIGAAGMLGVTGNPLYSGLIFASPILGGQFAKKVLMNPKYAAIASGMLKASPRSATAKAGAKAILGAMKGAQVLMVTPEGREVPATINEQGIPIPNNPKDQEPE